MSIDSSLNFRRVSDSVTTSGTVAAEDLAELRANGYEVVVNLMPDDSSYAVAGEAAIVEDAGVGYVYIPVDFAAPTAEDFDRFATAMDASAGKTVHVHCAANYRVSAFYSLYALRRGWWDATQADAHIRTIWDPAEYPAWEAFIAAERARPA
jgi:uncharacterized protein (TIGR01244 family)